MDISKAAEQLLEAYLSGVPIAPLTETFGHFTLDQAYQIQLCQVDRWRQDGRAIKGHKVGLTSAAMRRQMGVDESDFGHLTDAMFHLDAAPIDLGRYLQPRIEPETAFVLRRGLAGPGVTAAEAAAAVDFVLPALEIIDSRIKDWKITLPGHPLNALVWLANTIAAHGVALEPGDVILPGSITASVPVAAGQTVTASFAGLGTVTASFGSVTTS